MGILNFFKSKKDKANDTNEKSVLGARKYGVNVNETIPVQKSVLAARKYGEIANDPLNEKPKEKFIEKLSLLELSEINWSDFGAKLKQEQLLPPSYDRHPTSVKFRLSKTNKPVAEIVFNSKTSDSYRTIVIHDDNDVFEYTNGAQNMPTRKELVDVWQDFKRGQKLKISHNKHIESINIKNKANRLKRTAESMLNIDELFADELEFLENHKNDVFDFFGYMLDEEREIPFFVTTSEQSDDEYSVEEMVTPFSPKTLEFCVSRLTDEEKYCIVEDETSLKDFVSKCKNIATNSIYETDKWDKTINLLTDMLKEFAEKNCPTKE